jgi:propanol-preferring alcohol dehydrogenase
VIGVGGLGHVGVQILRALTQATIIALDVTEEKLELASKVGAHHTVISSEGAVDKVRELTGGYGAEAVFDFVGAPPTTELARQMVAINGFIHIVGIGGGTLQTGIFSTPFGASVRAPYWGTRSELMEVLDLARSGALTVHVEQFAIEDAVEAYHKLHEGAVSGRAVIAF